MVDGCVVVLCQTLVKKGITAFAMQSGLSKDDFGWGSPTFHKMVRPDVVCMMLSDQRICSKEDRPSGAFARCLLQSLTLDPRQHCANCLLVVLDVGQASCGAPDPAS